MDLSERIKSEMKLKKILLILSLCFLFVFVSVGFVKAQDVDVDSMSNEELMVLLQSIIRKLDQNESKEALPENAEETEVREVSQEDAAKAELSVPVEVTVPTAEPEADVAEKTFEVYENKKLIIGRMPDSYFIRKDNGGGDDKDEDGGDGIDIKHGGVWEDIDDGDGTIYIPWTDNPYIPPDNYIRGQR